MSILHWLRYNPLTRFFVRLIRRPKAMRADIAKGVRCNYQRYGMEDRGCMSSINYLVLTQKPQTRTIQVKVRGTESPAFVRLEFPYTTFIVRYGIVHEKHTTRFVYFNTQIGFSLDCPNDPKATLHALPLGNYEGEFLNVCMGNSVEPSYKTLPQLADAVVSGYWQSVFYESHDSARFELWKDSMKGAVDFIPLFCFGYKIKDMVPHLDGIEFKPL